jgi:coenzyme F420-reducing hydrogenase beta subunit
LAVPRAVLRPAGAGEGAGGAVTWVHATAVREGLHDLAYGVRRDETLLPAPVLRRGGGHVDLQLRHRAGLA